MWDFEIGSVMTAMVKTAPFIVFRMLVYFGIAIGYLFAVGAGAGIGFAVGLLISAPGAALWGGFIGFGLASAILFWAREYLLYVVKAGHIAVLVEHFDGRELPGGRGQIEHAHAVVKERFVETSVLFGVDILIKGILRVINRTLFRVARFIPVPAIRNLASFLNKIVTLSLTYVDEVILAYNIRTRSTNPWASSKDALILYAQNYKVMLKNALFLLFFIWGITLVIFVIFLAPAGILVALLPGTGTGLVLVASLLLAWAFKAALLEPLAVAALMQVYFKTIDGQVPDPEWDARISQYSKKFTELKEKAAQHAPSPAAATSSPAPQEGPAAT